MKVNLIGELYGLFKSELGKVKWVVISYNVREIKLK